MAEDIDVPRVGKVPRKVLIPIVVVAGGFIAWRYYAARGGAADGEIGEDTGYEDPGLLPGVSGAVRPDGDYGSGSAPPSTDDFGFSGHSNDEWTQYAITHLSQSDRWSYADIASALGNYLDRKPLSTLHQEIVRAALAVAGNPPVGTYTIVSGGNTPITVAPTGLSATTTQTTARISFAPVAGAAGYKLYRSGYSAEAGGGHSSPITLTDLTPNTSYQVQVAAVSSAGQVGPKSAVLTVKTPTAALGTPNMPKVSSVTKNSAVVTTNGIRHATGYDWYHAGRIIAHTGSPTLTMTRLTSKATYRVSVRATSQTTAPSKTSYVVTFKTK